MTALILKMEESVYHDFESYRVTREIYADMFGDAREHEEWPVAEGWRRVESVYVPTTSDKTVDFVVCFCGRPHRPVRRPARMCVVPAGLDGPVNPIQTKNGFLEKPLGFA